MSPTTILTNQLKAIFGHDLIFSDTQIQEYSTDLTTNYKPNGIAVVFPTSVEQVVDLVKWANQTGTSLVPSGGRTGYSGGAVAQHQEVVVSFEKMNRVINVNPDDHLLTCEASVTLQRVRSITNDNGLFYPVNYAPKAIEKAQVGGNIATNAGGINVIRYGNTRSWVAGLKVVTGQGDVMALNNGLIKNSTGYDLRHLFIGSEGTLGFIVEATLHLTSQPRPTHVMLLSVPENIYLINILNKFKSIATVQGFEFFSDAALQYVINKTDLDAPFHKHSPCYAIVEFSLEDRSTEAFDHMLSECINSQLINDYISGLAPDQHLHLWRYRTEISLSLLEHKPYKYDIGVLPSKIPEFIKDTETIFNTIYPGMEIIWFGHVGDGNLHLNVLKPATLATDEFFALCARVSNQLYSLIERYKGTVSAEHGIGLLKKDFLKHTKTQTEIDYMRQIKTIFDPNYIMNPGKIFDSE